ncbi:MAG: hypothetical protein JZD41_05535 [Thermoproteus sp.]|nr:hypothetical protein [Thermoproteus sp.]
MNAIERTVRAEMKAKPPERQDEYVWPHVLKAFVVVENGMVKIPEEKMWLASLFIRGMEGYMKGASKLKW